MATDHTGQPLAVGDAVLIPATVVAIRERNGCWTLEVRTDHKQNDGRIRSVLVVQACQVEKVPEGERRRAA
jgi:hypothetical protein